MSAGVCVDGGQEKDRAATSAGAISQRQSLEEIIKIILAFCVSRKILGNVAAVSGREGVNTDPARRMSGRTSLRVIA